MNRTLEERLREFHAHFDRDYSVGRRRLMAALESGAGCSDRGRSVLPYALGTAAALLIAVGLWIVSSSGRTTLYASMLEALRRCDTAHVVREFYRDGALQSVLETRYARGVGFRRDYKVEGRTRTTIEDRDYIWLYGTDSTIVAKVENPGSVDDPRRLARTLDEFIGPGVEPVREPAGDKRIRVETCRLYTFDDRGRTVKAWVDPDGVVREFESRREEAGVVETYRGRIEIDRNIDREVFQPALPPDAQVVDPIRLVKERFPLDDALYKRETLGRVFAVHSLERIDAKWVHMVSSIRLTKAVEEELGAVDPRRSVGGFHLGSDWGTQPVTRSLQIAALRVGDVEVQWHLLGVEGSDGLRQCRLNVSTSAANELARLLAADRGADHRGVLSDQFAVELSPPERDGVALDLGELLTAIHALGRELAPVLTTFHVFEVVPNPPKTNGLLEARDPRQFSLDDFSANVCKRMEKLGKSWR